MLRAPSRRPVIGAGPAEDRLAHVGRTDPRASARARGRQLALELPLDLPPIAIAPEWKAQQRLWGHSFHPMCSYLASFPAALTHAFIARYSRPGDVVLDPFSGRGTTPLQACAEGRIGVGNDLNPFAHLLTASKVEPGDPSRRPRRAWPQLRLALERGRRRLAGARRTGRPPTRRAPPVPPAGSGGGPPAHEAVPAEVALAFHPHTLGQLLFVRASLRLDDRTDRFLAAAITGILHGKSASYLSELMPNTFSMAPRYVRDFAARTAFASPRRDVFDGLGRQARPAVPPAGRPPPRASRCSAMPGTSRRAPWGPSAIAAGPTGRASWSPRRRTCAS